MCTRPKNLHSCANCAGDYLYWMLKLSQFCAYTGQKLAQLGGKIAQARWPCWPLFASLSVYVGINALATQRMYEGKVWISIVTLHATHFVDAVSVPTDEWQNFQPILVALPGYQIPVVKLWKFNARKCEMETLKPATIRPKLPITFKTWPTQSKCETQTQHFQSFVTVRSLHAACSQ